MPGAPTDQVSKVRLDAVPTPPVHNPSRRTHVPDPHFRTKAATSSASAVGLSEANLRCDDLGRSRLVDADLRWVQPACRRRGCRGAGRSRRGGPDHSRCIICDANFEPVGVVEYQGAGHKGRNRASRQRAEESDRQKRRALTEAGVPMIEVPARYESAWLRDRINELHGTNGLEQRELVPRHNLSKK